MIMDGTQRAIASPILNAIRLIIVCHTLFSKQWVTLPTNRKFLKEFSAIHSDVLVFNFRPQPKYSDDSDKYEEEEKIYRYTM